MEGYEKQAMRTNSVEMFPTVERHELLNVIENCIFWINKLDRIKKALFYGQGTDGPVKNPLLWDNPQDIQILHSALGLATESGEILENLVAKIDNSSYDHPNLVEELGDLMWYQAIMCDALSINFAEVQRKNIDKLKRRYPEKFSCDKAINRNVIIENGVFNES